MLVRDTDGWRRNLVCQTSIWLLAGSFLPSCDLSDDEQQFYNNNRSRSPTEECTVRDHLLLHRVTRQRREGFGVSGVRRTICKRLAYLHAKAQTLPV